MSEVIQTERFDDSELEEVMWGLRWNRSVFTIEKLTDRAHEAIITGNAEELERVIQDAKSCFDVSENPQGDAEYRGLVSNLSLVLNVLKGEDLPYGQRG